MRLGILGGSFDPVHYGHLLLAECCREQLALDEVWFIPAAVPPHKQMRHLSDAKHRLRMLELATAGNPAFVVSDIEIRRGGVSYTVETLEAVRQLRPDAQLFLIVGADMFNDLPNWYRAPDVLQLAIPCVARRAGFPEPDLQLLAPLVSAERIEAIRKYQVEMPQVDLQSSDIRQRVAQGRSIRYRTPTAVEQYILAHGLYREE